MRDGLVTDIRELDPPATVEVLFFDGCPNHDAFLPHLTGLFAEHHIGPRVTVTRIEGAVTGRAFFYGWR